MQGTEGLHSVQVRKRMKKRSYLYPGSGGTADNTRKPAMIELSSVASLVRGSFVFHLFWLLMGPLAC